MRTVVVVGASLAGLRAAEELRRGGFAGRLVLIGAEPQLPYDRPPLSKGFLAGSRDAASLSLRPSGLDDLDLDLRLGVRAEALDAEARVVELDTGERVAFDGAVVATGAAPRVLHGAPPLDGVVTLRTLGDADDLRARVAREPRIVVIGAGFIGSEVAATCRGLGLHVTVVEALPAPMVRGLGTALGTACGELHVEHGVDLRLGVSVSELVGHDRVEAVLLGDGSVLPADLVVVGIGAAPVTDWLAGSGLTIDDGVVCDDTLLAAPGIVAAGDVARWPNPLFGGQSMRVEHWTNASEQGVAAARRLLAGDDGPAFASVPYVWSDQYGLKLQSAGSFRGDDDMEVVHGALADHKFVAVFGRGGRLVGAMGIGMPGRIAGLVRMIGGGASFDEALEAARAA